MPKNLSFSELYGRYYEKCVSFARVYVFDSHEAGAIASDALMVFWDKEEYEGDPLPFLLGVVRNKVLNVLRGRAREKAAMENAAISRDIEARIIELEACDPHALFTSDILSIVEATLEYLPSKTRSVFLMSRRNGLSHKEISQRLGISEKAVEYHLTSAMKRLRDKLKDYL